MISIFKYCPKCGSQDHSFENNHRFECHNCGFVYYHNMAAAVMCVISKGDQFLFTIRNNEPARGMLDFPGGFVDPGESAQQATLRELKEELGLELKESDLELIDSFPNRYFFKDIHYQTLDIIFKINLDDNASISITDDEIEDFKWLKAEEVDLDQIGFESMKQVVKKYVIK